MLSEARTVHLQGVSVDIEGVMMLNIISAEQRLAEKKGHKLVVCGQSGWARLLLPEPSTLPRHCSWI